MQGSSVVNIRHEQCDFYCGRPSFVGNPYEIGRDGTREEVISKYKIWFYNKIKDITFRDRVLKLHNKRLGCWCKPLACHCDIIVEYLNNYYNIQDYV